jgi:4a-hydroxytetrahydrobiopterin dehydratase
MVSSLRARPDPAVARLAVRVRGADNGVVATPLSDSEIEQALVALPGWARAGDQIVKWYELESFNANIAFVVRIGEAADAADHHPDLDIRYSRLRVALSTHDAGGITRKDVDLAREIEELHA